MSKLDDWSFSRRDDGEVFARHSRPGGWRSTYVVDMTLQPPGSAELDVEFEMPDPTYQSCTYTWCLTIDVEVVAEMLRQQGWTVTSPDASATSGV